MKNVLVVAAHPDDEVLGVGGTVLKHVAAGDKVYVCLVTSAYEPEWSKDYIEQKIVEQAQVDKLLGIAGRFNLDQPTVKLNTLPHGELNNKIAVVIDQVKPSIVYTHFEGDLNYDHTLIYRACAVGTRPPKTIKLLCYETLSETEWNNRAFVPNVWVGIERQIEQKIKAFEIYASEVKAPPHPRNAEGLITLAKKRGLEICADYAEAFMLIREIQR
ncbi:MAG: PIG-L family deacetylase [Candidatus Margulisiibacteriota bacterium]